MNIHVYHHLVGGTTSEATITFFEELKALIMATKEELATALDNLRLEIQASHDRIHEDVLHLQETIATLEQQLADADLPPEVLTTIEEMRSLVNAIDPVADFPPNEEPPEEPPVEPEPA